MAGALIVGGGQAGFQVAASLRQEGYEEPITLVGDEPGLPYQRPPLSKAYMAGEVEAEGLAFGPSSFFGQNQIELIAGVRVTEIHRAKRSVQLNSGHALAYDHLVLAVGARNRRLQVPGVELDGVFYLRTVGEADAIRRHLAPGVEIVVIGAGFIGLEFASVANQLGASVTVVEMHQRPMARAVSPEISRFCASKHTSLGNRLLFETSIERIFGVNGRVTGVQTSEGQKISADLVLIGIGVIPNVELAASAGLPVGDGIIVDEGMLTADEAISAIGDCALHFSRFASRCVRLESVQNASDQARVVVARLMGRPSSYAAVPWFWSDQGPYKLQIAGLTAAADHTVLRGDPSGGAFSVFCFVKDKFVGVESINRGADHLIARRLLAANVAISPEIAADQSADLKRFTASPGLAHE